MRPSDLARRVPLVRMKTEQPTDEEMAAAVVDSLAGIEHCAICWDRPEQFCCRSSRPSTGETFAFCGGCVVRFRKQHNQWNTGQAMRVLRYLAYKGWLQTFLDTPGKFNSATLYEQLTNSMDFRGRWLN